MRDAAEMRVRHAEALKVLAERALALACAVQERALVAETDAGMAELGLAFHRIARSVRQCLALEAKLTRDAEQAAREARAEAARDLGVEAKRRRGHLRNILRRDIFNAAPEDDEADEAGDKLEALESLLDEDEFCGDFLALPVEEQIARLRDDLGLAESALAEAAPAAGPEAAPPAAPPVGSVADDPGSGEGALPAFATVEPNSS